MTEKDTAQVGSTFGSVFGGALGSAAGHAVGAGVGYLLNEATADNQLERQKELQQQAFGLNQLAAQNQASIEVNGLRAAGLNPAIANGAGAASISPGSASAGTTPTLGNVFDGIANIIAAAKAPSDISRTQAETSNLGAMTGKIGEETKEVSQRVNIVTPKVVSKLDADISNTLESVRNAKNFNDAYEAQNKFLKENSQFVFSQMQSKLESQGLWDSLSEDTKDTISKLASGEISVSQGEYDGLIKTINAQKLLSDSDMALVKNAFDTNVLVRQFQNSGTMKALETAPADAKAFMYKQMKKIDAEIQGIYQDIKVGKAEVALKRAQKLKTEFERESSELNDVKWLIKNGRYDDADVRTWEQSLDNMYQMLGKVVDGAGHVASGAAVGKSLQSGSVNTPKIVPPSDKQVIQVNSPSTFGRHLDFR